MIKIATATMLISGFITGLAPQPAAAPGTVGGNTEQAALSSSRSVPEGLVTQDLGRLCYEFLPMFCKRK